MAGTGVPDLPTVDAAGLRLGVVATRWHHDLTDQLLARALDAAKGSGVTDIVTARVAGSVELPVVALELAHNTDAVVALGVVVKGETAHFEYVCRSVTDGLTRIALDTRTPVGQGVLTVYEIGQAYARAGLPDSTEDKGADAALAALDAAVTLRRLRAGWHSRTRPVP